MYILSFLGYLGLIALGVFAVALAVRLYSKYRTRYLFSLMMSVIFLSAFNFLNIVANYMAVGILNAKLTIDSTTKTVGLIFSLLALPFLLTSWFFLIRTVFDILRLRFRKGLQLFYLAFQILLFLSYLITINRYFVTDDIHARAASSDIVFYLYLLNYLVLIVVFALIFRRRASFSSEILKKGFQIFALLHILGFILHFVSVHLLIPSEILCYGYPVLAFFLPLPPILYLTRLLNVYYREYKGIEVSADSLQLFFDRYNISRREKEIVTLVLKGQSNRDIGDTLYISIKTVKTHVYNIYKKLNIKNRFQLINLIHNSDNG